MDQNYVYEKISQLSSVACERMNQFSAQILKTRGGRIGSGMGALLEALWGYMMNQIILEENDLDCEIAWFPDNQYNDFSCIRRDTVWDSTTRTGEYFRIEAKSMNVGADESKAHFAALDREIEKNDALLILVWEWRKIDDFHFSPIVIDSFFDRAKGVAMLRDALHIARGGYFVDSRHCPDGCQSYCCTHKGEPLNAEGKRERLSGPEATRPSLKVSYAANFGGLVRMLKTDNENARNVLRNIRRQNLVADHYISFIHKNFPNEEKNQYTVGELRRVATSLGMNSSGMSKDALYNAIRSIENYQTALKSI
ncbi:MAG: hypothetical protein J6K29_06480 [Clostridia bacterium]|nr:hypothetical protein [Clostridia bacterium]